MLNKKPSQNNHPSSSLLVEHPSPSSAIKKKPLWHGLLLVYKEAGCTSHSLVHSLRKILGQKEVGHGGTLDPIAEGLLLILLGHGTKLSDYLLTGDKRYLFTFRLGTTTDTLDSTGKILSQQTVQIPPDNIQAVLKKNQGPLCLPVPLFSAVKIRGKKLYEYVRENQAITPPNREMFFYDLEIKNILPDQVEVELSCHKGSYIRAWVATVGEQLGVGACLEKLTRLTSHPFHVKSALRLKEIHTCLTTHASSPPTRPTPSDEIIQKLKGAFIPFSQALPHIQPVTMSQDDTQQLKNGRLSTNLLYRLQSRQKETNQQKTEQTLRAINQQNNQLLALLKLRPFQSPKIIKVFPPLP